MNKNIIELLPCPFCGSNNIEVHRSPEIGNSYCRVLCSDCGISTQFHGKQKKAIDVWNKRLKTNAVKAAKNIKKTIKKVTKRN